MRQMAEQVQETFRPASWREELEVFYRQRKSVWFVLAAMIAMSAFWTNVWAWVVFFFILGIYSAAVGVRMGTLCGLSFAAWFIVGIESAHLGHAFTPGGWVYRAFGLWCIATLFLVIVWKADGVAQIKKHREAKREEGVGGE